MKLFDLSSSEITSAKSELDSWTSTVLVALPNEAFGSLMQTVLARGLAQSGENG